MTFVDFIHFSFVVFLLVDKRRSDRSLKKKHPLTCLDVRQEFIHEEVVEFLDVFLVDTLPVVLANGRKEAVEKREGHQKSNRVCGCGEDGTGERQKRRKQSEERNKRRRDEKEGFCYSDDASDSR